MLPIVKRATINTVLRVGLFAIVVMIGYTLADAVTPFAVSDFLLIIPAVIWLGLIGAFVVICFVAELFKARPSGY